MPRRRTIPKIYAYMSTTPHTVGAEQTLAHARELMQRHRVHHLPVVASRRFVGIVSEDDLRAAEASGDPAQARVEQAMSDDVYVVAPDAPIDEVVLEMARFKYGSVVVLDNDDVVGLFTTDDACRAFADMLVSHLA